MQARVTCASGTGVTAAPNVTDAAEPDTDTGAGPTSASVELVCGQSALAAASSASTAEALAAKAAAAASSGNTRERVPPAR